MGTCMKKKCEVDCLLGPWTRSYDVNCSKTCTISENEPKGYVVVTREPLDYRDAQGNSNEQNCIDLGKGPLSPERRELRECAAFGIETDPCPKPIHEDGFYTCKAMLNLHISVDSSGSLGQKGWDDEVAGVGQMIKSIDDPTEGESQQFVSIVK